MSLAYGLTFGGIPFVSDTAKIIRQGPPDIPAGQVDTQTPIRRQQPEVSLVDELNRLIPFRNINDFRVPQEYTSRNLNAIARKNPVDPNPEGVRIGEWYYPVGATRWSLFRGLATSSQTKAMIEVTYQPNNPTPSQWNVGEDPSRAFAGSVPAMLSMTSQPLNPVSDLGYTVESLMYMLPPRPLGETLGVEGLFLITLCDSRFFWQYAPTSAFMTVYPNLSTWTGYIQNIATALGVSINFSSPIPDVYTGPEADSQFWVNMENCAFLLDACAYNLGCRVVRNLNGTYTLQRPADSAATILLNRTGLKTANQRLAGGNIFDSTAGLATGPRGFAVNQVVPASVNVTFPLYCPTNTPVPHYLNPRTITPQRPSSWYEESFGDVFIQNVPLADIDPSIIGVVSATGVIGADVDIEVAPYVHTIHTTAKALVPNDGSVLLLNSTGIEDLATQIATDYYAWQTGISLDEVYQGTVAWEPEGGHDVVWTYSERQRLASCRVTRTIWNSIIREMQHTTPPAPAAGVYTSTPPGVGGHSVAQSWKDSNIAEVGTNLALSMGPTDTFVQLNSVDSLPTQNRWNAQIDHEIVQFDGTSGGLYTGQGYFVTVAQTNIWNTEVPLLSGTYARGTQSTLPATHVAGTPVVQITPDMTHGVNVVTTEKGQYTHPSDWGEGIQGVNIKPQTQTVFVWSASGVTAPSTPTYYSGAVVIPNPTNTSQATVVENIWVQERNDNPVASGKYYDGQLFAYSINPYVDDLGNQIPTTGAVNPIYLVNQDVNNPPLSETAIISIISHTLLSITLTGNGSGQCTTSVMQAQVWNYDGCEWQAGDQCYYSGPNTDVPPLCIRFVARKIDSQATTDNSPGLVVYTKEAMEAVIQVTSLTQSSVTTCDGGTLKVYPAILGSLENTGTSAEFVERGIAWFLPLNGEIPRPLSSYSCQALSADTNGVVIWGTHLATPTAAQNVLAPTNIANPLFTLYAANDQGSKAFGRIVFTQDPLDNVGNAPTGTFDVIEWQGIRSYVQGQGYLGPEPDLQFTAGLCFNWVVADNPSQGTIAIQGNVDLGCIAAYIINNIGSIVSCEYIQSCVTSLDCNQIKENCITCSYVQSCITCGFLLQALNPSICDSCLALVWPCVYTLYSNQDCTNEKVWPAQVNTVFAKNKVGESYSTADFGHIIWVPATGCTTTYTDALLNTHTVGGVGGYFSWQGIRIQDGIGTTVGPGEDIILKGSKCAAGSGNTIKVAVSSNVPNVEADFSTIGCTGTIDLCYVDTIDYTASTCSLSIYLTSITLTFNCGLLIDATCNFVHQLDNGSGGCRPLFSSPPACSDIVSLTC